MELRVKLLLLSLVLSGIGVCDLHKSSEADSHEISERQPAPEPEPDADPAPAWGRYGNRYSRYSSSSYSSGYGYKSGENYSGYNSNFYDSSYGRPSGKKTPNIDQFKAQSEQKQNIQDQCYSAHDYQCNPKDKYRSVDGTCNNLRRPWWGAFGTAHVRLMQPYYEDGVDRHRLSQADDSELPSPRLLSTIFLPDRDVPDIHTRMYLQFSQLVAHDTTLNPEETIGPKCCSESGASIQTTSGNCRPISIPSNDSFYSQFDRRCLEYKRSEASNCSVGPLQPIVRNTHFIDLSFVYGSQVVKANDLRTFSRGQMKVRSVNGKAYLPVASDPSTCPFARKNCYDAGDPRVNQHLDLAVSQTVWLRFHNYIANRLIQLNPRWSNNDQLVYQESKRIATAVFQHITYNEWLPILIGDDYSRKIGLAPTKSGYFTVYSSKVNPSTLADYAAGAFRGLHSLIPGVVDLDDEGRSTTRQLPFSSTLQHPGDFLEEGDTFDSTLRGLNTQREQFQDRFMTEQITNFLIDADVPERAQGRFGDDLAARDIHRGRDFGLRPYVDYRQLCGLSRPKNFRELNDFLESAQIYRLSQIYKDVRDIDYYIGGLLEGLVSGTLSSPSFRCVFAESFYRYKYGDRYFYEGSPKFNPGAFSQDQLNGIKRSVLSHVNCIGSDSISQIQRQAFFQPSSSNPLVPCSQLQAEFDNILNRFQEGF